MATDQEANRHGVEAKETVRRGLIEVRDSMLSIQRWNETVLLSHAVWWLADGVDTGRIGDPEHVWDEALVALIANEIDQQLYDDVTAPIENISKEYFAERAARRILRSEERR